MTVYLTPEKARKLSKACKDMLTQDSLTIRDVAQLVGRMVGSFPGVEYGKLYYRILDNEKSRAITLSKGDFDATMTLSDRAKQDIAWWRDNIHCTYKLISHGNPSVILQSDACNTGWGGVHGTESTGGNWSDTEAQYHINYLELLAAWLTLQTFCADMNSVHVQLQLDNTTAVAYVNGQGGKKKLCNTLASQVWEWCRERDIWISACYLPGVDNVEADRQSRLDHNNTEWQLNPVFFHKLVELWGNPHIDLFASRLNYQVKPYVSWKRDPGAIAVDAFTIPWEFDFYAFPPFSMIGRMLVKVQEEGTEGTMIAPYWTTQPWFSKLARLLIDCPFLLPRSAETLLLPERDTSHPLTKMRLAAFRLSGITSKANNFRQRLLTSSCHHGDYPRADNMNPTSGNGWSFAVKGVKIHAHHLLDR